MPRIHINTTVIEGNLTRPPELRRTGGNTAVTTLRIGSNARRTKGGEHVERTNFFDIEVYGGQAEVCCEHLVKGSPVTVQGELSFHEWPDRETGQQRSKVVVLAHIVSFGPPVRGQTAAAHRPAEENRPARPPAPPAERPAPRLTAVPQPRPAALVGKVADENAIPF
jgi:single-strand DNA-binding protein